MDCSPPGSSVHGILQARTLLRMRPNPSGTAFPIPIPTISVENDTWAPAYLPVDLGGGGKEVYVNKEGKKKEFKWTTGQNLKSIVLNVQET